MKLQFQLIKFINLSNIPFFKPGGSYNLCDYCRRAAQNRRLEVFTKGCIEKEVAPIYPSCFESLEGRRIKKL